VTNTKTTAVEQLIAEIRDVEAILYNAIDDLGGPLAEVVRARLPYIFPLRRGALTLTAGIKVDSESDNRSQRIQLAAALEMLYLALNVHQLLLNTGLAHTTHRRGANEANSLPLPEEIQPDKSVIGSTILAGDYCFSRSAQMAAHTQNPSVVALFAQALQIISEGLLRQVFHQEEPAFDVQQALSRSGILAAVELATLDEQAKTAATELALEIVATGTLPAQSKGLMAQLPAYYQPRWFALVEWSRQQDIAASS
jgi:geranylgeranyl pyrophosphate synthase